MRLRLSDAHLVELGVATAVLAVANALFAPHNPAFLGIQPHPALIAVAIVGAWKGLRAGAFAGVVLAALLLVTWSVRTEIILPGAWWRLSTYATPLMVAGAGLVFGAIGDAHRRKALHLSDRVRHLQLELADQAVRFMAATEASHELERRVIEETASLTTLHAAARALDTLDLESLYPGIVTVARRFIDADACQLYLVEGGLLSLREAQGDQPLRTHLPIDDGLVGLAIRRGRAVSIRDWTAVAAVEDLKQASILLAAPLVGPDAALLGCLTVTHLPFLRLTPAAVDRLGVAADWAARAIVKAKAHAATRDGMTDAALGAYTYAYYQRRIAEEQARADRYARPLSVVIMTIERLSDVLPRHWPELGRLLGVIAKQCLRDADLFCRYVSEGSFAVILPETSADVADGVGKRIAAEVSGFRFRPYADERAELALDIRVLAVRSVGAATDSIRDTEGATTGPRSGPPPCDT
jgi:GGDEF domain-containing protein